MFVNRAWQSHFGRGLVETAEDFGSQGSLPTNPALLDYLAVTFRESGWDIKKLAKAIVMSGPYRQQSDANEELLRKDPNNLLLARFTRLRMPAEMVRDQALAASGLLVRKLAGRASTRINHPTCGTGSTLTTIQHRMRCRPMPIIAGPCIIHQAQRAASRDGVVRPAGSRRRDGAPPDLELALQALVLLDDPQFLEANRALAGNVLKTETEQDARLTKVFRLATRRHPIAAEMAAMRDYHSSQLQRYASDREAAVQLLSVGVTPVDQSIDPVQLAALTNLTTVVMNTPDAYSLR